MQKLMLIMFGIIFLCCTVHSMHIFDSDSQGSKNKPIGSVYTIIKVRYPQENVEMNSTLYLRGDLCNLTWIKGVAVKRTAQPDTWTTALLCPIDTKITMKVLINDTKWMMGANHVFTLTENITQTTIFPSFNPRINKIGETLPFYSAVLKNIRKLSIYFPPSYYDNPYKKYELLLLHDGQNLFDDKTSAFGTAWMCQDTVNTLIGSGKIKQIIIVGIWNTNDRINQYTYSYDPSEKMGGKGDLYLDFIQKELLPKLRSIDLQGRLDDSKGVGIGGSSLGGLISCYALYTRPTIFNKAVCMSSSFWWNNEDFKSIVAKTRVLNPNSSFYLDSGDSGPSQDSKVQTQNVKAALLTKGYVLNNNLYYYLDKGGQHSQAYWGKRFWVPMTDLYHAE